MLAGRYFDGRSARLYRVVLRAEGEGFAIEGDSVARAFARGDVALAPKLGRIARTLAFADGAQLQFDDDDPRLETWFAAGDRVQGFADRVERRWRWVAVSALAVTATMALLFTRGVPWLADEAAQRVPRAAEAALAGQVVDLLDRLYFEPSRLPETRRAELGARFDALVANLPREAEFDLRFRASPVLGPNALALPGGIVILTDELVALAGHDEEILAVLAHEAGHHEHRHALRAAMQDSAVVLLIGFIAGDASSLGSLAVSVPAVLLTSGYSRGFEGEADAFAFALLERRGISPARFADIMQKLTQHVPKEADALGWISTHPASADRIAAARRAAGAD